MQIYQVGGAVRDYILGVPSQDKDYVVVGATPKQMLKLGFKPVGKHFPVFLHPTTGDEYALARTERKNGIGYSGFDFYTAPSITLKQDLKRRDLTINAIAMDENGNIIDPFGGVKDIEHKILRHVSCAFIEDPLRVLRVARFAARFAHLGFTIADETAQLMRQITQNNELLTLSVERIWQEFTSALNTQNPQVFIEVLHNCGALQLLLPELTNTKDANNLLFKSVKANLTLEMRFTALVFNLTFAQITNICKRYKIPTNYADLALLANKLKPLITDLNSSLHNKNNNHAADLIMQILKNSDYCRRSYRLLQVLDLFTVCSAANLKTYNLILNCASQTALITYKDLANTITGKQISIELNKLRLNKVIEILNLDC